MPYLPRSPPASPRWCAVGCCFEPAVRSAGANDAALMHERVGVVFLYCVQYAVRRVRCCTLGDLRLRCALVLVPATACSLLGRGSGAGGGGRVVFVCVCWGGGWGAGRWALCVPVCLHTGHRHEYFRVYPIYNNTFVTSYTQPPYPVHLVVGAAGCGTCRCGPGPTVVCELPAPRRSPGPTLGPAGRARGQQWLPCPLPPLARCALEIPVGRCRAG